MPVDLHAALNAANDLCGYERWLLASLVSRPSVRAEASDVHDLCVRELEKLGMEVELITPRVEELERPSRVVSAPSRPAPSPSGL